MSEGSSSARKLSEPSDSLFPPDEALSYCSRPTPLVPPPSHDLRDFGREKLDAHASGTHVIGSASSRPTVGPGELDAFPYTESNRPTYAPDDVLAEMLQRATVGTPIPAPPPLPTAVTLEAPPRARASARRVVARSVGMVTLSGLLAFAGYAFQPHLVGAAHGLWTRVAAFVATH